MCAFNHKLIRFLEVYSVNNEDGFMRLFYGGRWIDD